MQISLGPQTNGPSMSRSYQILDESIVIFEWGYTWCFLTYTLDIGPKLLCVSLIAIADYVLLVTFVWFPDLVLNFWLEPLVSILVSLLASPSCFPIGPLLPTYQLSYLPVHPGMGISSLCHFVGTLSAMILWILFLNEFHVVSMESKLVSSKCILNSYRSSWIPLISALFHRYIIRLRGLGGRNTKLVSRRSMSWLLLPMDGGGLHYST